MSDALTDITRSEQRGSLLSRYFESILFWLQNPSPESYQKVADVAAAADRLTGGYWGEAQTELAKSVESLLRSLAVGDEQVWIDLLFSLESWCVTKFAEFSPFKGMTLVFYKHGRVSDVVRGGRDCRIFQWEWNSKDYQFGNDGKWVLVN